MKARRALLPSLSLMLKFLLETAETDAVAQKKVSLLRLCKTTSFSHGDCCFLYVWTKESTMGKMQTYTVGPWYFTAPSSSVSLCVSVWKQRPDWPLFYFFLASFSLLSHTSTEGSWVSKYLHNLGHRELYLVISPLMSVNSAKGGLI